MKRLLHYFLRRIVIYSAIVLAISIPFYYLIIRRLWEYELAEHQIILTPEAGREDSYLIIGAVVLIGVIFFILLLGALIVLNRQLAGRMWQPFYKSLDKIRAFDLAKTDPVQLERSDIAEFNELNIALERLLAGNAAAFNQQREFADNASHELQTPLAIVKSKLELLSQAGNLSDEQYRDIETATEALSRASRINRNLLLLTKIENSQFNDREVIRLAQMLNKVLDQFSLFFEQQELMLTTHIVPGVTVTGNAMLTEILIGNLLMNAIRYSPGGGEVVVTLSGAAMIIQNEGEGPLQEDQLFRRFARASPTKPGAGLGLAIVQQVCARQGWKASYSWLNHKHVFSIQFDQVDADRSLAGV